MCKVSSKEVSGGEWKGREEHRSGRKPPTEGSNLSPAIQYMYSVEMGLIKVAWSWLLMQKGNFNRNHNSSQALNLQPQALKYKESLSSSQKTYQSAINSQYQILLLVLINFGSHTMYMKDKNC